MAIHSVQYLLFRNPTFIDLKKLTIKNKIASSFYMEGGDHLSLYIMYI